MTNIRMISDVPKDKLEQVTADLQYEVGRENVRAVLQPDGNWRLEYIVGGAPLQSGKQSLSGSGSFLK